MGLFSILSMYAGSFQASAESRPFEPASLPPTHLILAHARVDTDHLSTSALRSIFSQRTKQWPSGLPVRVVVFKDDSQTHQYFCRYSLNMMAYQLRRVWAKQLYTGRGGAPIQVSTVKEMLSAVSRIPGAIGYVPSQTDLNQLSETLKTQWAKFPESTPLVDRHQPAWKVLNVE